MRKRYLIFCILSWILGIGIVPLNLFLISMPDITVYLVPVLIAVVTGLFLVFSGSKKAGKVIVTVLSAVAAAAFVLAGVVCNPYWNSTFFHPVAVPATLSYDTVLSRSDALEDFDYAMHYLSKLHPACLHGLPSEVEARRDEVRAKIEESDGVTVNDLWADIESVFSLLNDGHTCAQANYTDTLYLRYLYGFKEGGYTVTAVNGETVADMLQSRADLFSFECESWELENLTGYLASVQGLAYLGIDTDEGVTYVFENGEGDRQEVTYHTEDFVTIGEYYALNGIDDSAQSGDTPFVRYEIRQDMDLAVLTVDSCVINDFYRDTVRDMFTEVKALGIDNVLLDVRYNGGGNDAVVSEFIRYLPVDSYRVETVRHRLGFLMIPEGVPEISNQRYDDLTFTGNLYVASTANTFSSAMTFVQYIKDNGLGTVIGEAPGNDPNGYGDIGMFSLPNSGIYMQISTKRFCRADQECTDFLVEPDIPCDVRSDEALMEQMTRLIAGEV